MTGSGDATGMNAAVIPEVGIKSITINSKDKILAFIWESSFKVIVSLDYFIRGGQLFLAIYQRLLSDHVLKCEAFWIGGGQRSPTVG